MLTKITKFVKKNQIEIALILAAILISLLSFSLGYITAKDELKPEIKIENIN
jgi:hypothetical protein